LPERPTVVYTILKGLKKALENGIYVPKRLFLKKLSGLIRCRSAGKCRPGPTVKVPPFPPLKFAYKIMLRACKG